jgi:hypothetical protein
MLSAVIQRLAADGGQVCEVERVHQVALIYEYSQCGLLFQAALIYLVRRTDRDSKLKDLIGPKSCKSFAGQLLVKDSVCPLPAFVMSRVPAASLAVNERPTQALDEGFRNDQDSSRNISTEASRIDF